MNVLITILALLFTASAFAKSDCHDLKSDLKAFQQAQEQILDSLGENHIVSAETLEGYADLVVVAPGSTPFDISIKMTESAKAFRQRGEKAQEISMKLQKGTAELMQKVQSCLK